MTKTLSFLRFPLAVCVVFIHCYGDALTPAAMAIPWSAAWCYEIVRLIFSKVLPQFAVPLFFFISGYFFFHNMPQWNWRQYGAKLHRRVGTLLLPYLIWNMLYLFHISWPTLEQALTGQGSWVAWADRIRQLGGWHIVWDSHPFANGSTGPVLGPLWFLRDLIVVMLFTPLIYWLIRRIRWIYIVAVAVLYVADCWLPVHGFSAWACLWFSIGAGFSLEGRSIMQMPRWAKAGCAVAMASLFCFVLSLATEGRLAHNAVHLAYCAVSVATVVCASDHLLRHTAIKEHRCLTASAFFLYLSHIFFLKGTRRLVGFTIPLVGAGKTVGYFATPLLTMATCVAVYQLWRLLKERICHISIYRTNPKEKPWTEIRK